MSLLTDEDIENWKPLLPYPAKTAHIKKLLGLQQTKTLEAVGEWGDGYCDHRLNMEGHPVDSPPERRHACIFCRENLFGATRKGKMPGEE